MVLNKKKKKQGVHVSFGGGPTCLKEGQNSNRGKYCVVNTNVVCGSE